jgi:hypothetical protein
VAVAGQLRRFYCVPWRSTCSRSRRRGSVRIFAWQKQLPAVNCSDTLSHYQGGYPKSQVQIKGQAHSLAPVYLWWSWRGSNSRPLECHSSALPAELQPHMPGFRLSVGLLTWALRLCQYIYLDIYTLHHNNQRRAGVVKLVDAGDSKSPDSCSHVGSIPTSGTKNSCITYPCFLPAAGRRSARRRCRSSSAKTKPLSFHEKSKSFVSTVL